MITSVTVQVRARRRDVVDFPFTGVVYFGFRTYGVDYYASQTLENDTNYYDYSSAWTVNPSTGAPWTQHEVDALEGYLAQQGRNASGYRSGGHITQFYIEVTYGVGGSVVKRPNSSVDGPIVFGASGASTPWQCVDDETPDEDVTQVYHLGTTGSSSTASITFGLTVPAALNNHIGLGKYKLHVP